MTVIRHPINEIKCHSFIHSFIPTGGPPGSLFSITLPSITNWTRSPCCILITDMMALSSPTHLNTSSLQTLSDQENVEDLPPKPHLTGLQSLHVFFRQVHSLAPYELLQGKLSNLCFHKLKPY